MVTVRPQVAQVPYSEYTINYTTFIPSNYIEGPPQTRMSCGLGKPLFFAGDDRGFSPNATTFRTRQLVTVVLDRAAKEDGVRNGTKQNLVNPSKAYAPDALLDGRIDKNDDDNTLNDCHLLHKVGRASNSKMDIIVRRTGPRVLVIRLYGAVKNPLVFGAPEINWDVTITIDGENTRWSIEGEHDGFPAHELYINNVRCHSYAPPGNGFREQLKLFGPIYDGVRINEHGTSTDICIR